MPLTGKQRHHLRALAHHLSPVVRIGKEGISEAVTSQVDGAMEAHELVKVKLGSECPVGRDEAATLLAAATRSEVAQIIGRVIVMFRQRTKKSKIELPGVRKKDEKDGGVAPARRKKAPSKGHRLARKGGTRRARPLRPLRTARRKGGSAEQPEAAGKSDQPTGRKSR